MSMMGLANKGTKLVLIATTLSLKLQPLGFTPSPSKLVSCQQLTVSISLTTFPPIVSKSYTPLPPSMLTLLMDRP